MDTRRRKLRLLSLDGGGIRGLSTLLILQSLMLKVDPQKPPKPCEIFDMIAGTSTGGLIAIMLGRLRMQIDDCISAYLALSDKVFRKEHHRITATGKVQGRFSSDALEESVKKILSQQNFDVETTLLEPEDPHCKVFVCVCRGANRTITHFASYRSRRHANIAQPKIWEAARATSAAASFFDPIAIGPFGEEYLDGATGANNPINELWHAYEDIHPGFESEIECLVSIGTGVPGYKAFGQSIKDIAETLKDIATDTQTTAESFARSHTAMIKENRYFRFNVDRGLEDIGLEELSKRKEIAAATSTYLETEHILQASETCAARLKLSIESSNQFGSDRRLIEAVRDYNLRAVHDVFEVAAEQQPSFDAQHQALYWAALLGQPDTVNFLFQGSRGMALQPDFKTPEKFCFALQAAVISGHLDMVGKLLNHGANPNAIGGAHGTSLVAAISGGRLSIAKALLSARADPNAQGTSDGIQVYPLQVAARRKDWESVKLLRHHGANILLLSEGWRHVISRHWN